MDADRRLQTFLGAYISDGEPIPSLQWHSRPWAIDEIYRWMAQVSFNNQFRQEDCEELFGLFNIRRGTKNYLSAEKTHTIREEMLELIKTELLPPLRTNGIVRNGIWDPRAKLVWAQDDWDSRHISLDNLEKAFPSRRQIVPETNYSDVLANEKQSKAEYDTVKQALDSMAERHSKLFADYREQALKMDSKEDELLAQLMARHELLVSEHLETTKLMLQRYRMWQLYKTNRRIWKKKLSVPPKSTASILGQLELVIRFKLLLNPHQVDLVQTPSRRVHDVNGGAIPSLLTGTQSGVQLHQFIVGGLLVGPGSLVVVTMRALVIRWHGRHPQLRRRRRGSNGCRRCSCCTADGYLWHENGLVVVFVVVILQVQVSIRARFPKYLKLGYGAVMLSCVILGLAAAERWRWRLCDEVTAVSLKSKPALAAIEGNNKMETERFPTPPSTANSNYGDTVEDEQTEQYFTEREMEEVLAVANELDRLPAIPRQGRGATHFKITGAIIMALMAIIAFQYLRVPAAVEQPSASFADAGGITMRRHAVQDKAASRFAESLGELRGSIQPLKDLQGLADNIGLAASNSAIANSEAPNDAVKALPYVPEVLQRTTKELEIVTQFSETINCLLKESLGMVESEVMRVPKDAGAALAHFQHTLKRVELKLDTVLTLVETMILKIEERLKPVVLMSQALKEIAQALRRKGGGLWKWVPFSGATSTPKNELAWLEELSSEIDNMALPGVEGAAKVFRKYAAILRFTIIAKVGSQNTDNDDEGWVNVAILQTWMQYGPAESVVPQVLRNLKLLLQLLEEVQIG
ncbi:hypothetical protein BC567DRAFT_212983 [Phyllosticta citribraziliensis]